MSGRIACADVPALPLQLLARERKGWRDAPLVVVEADAPEAKILWADARARACSVRPGMRYASALALCRELRAAPVAAEAVEALRVELLAALSARTPRVEPDAARPGVFWLDPAGLVPLFGALDAWAIHVHDALTDLELTGAVVVGFSRLPCWAITRGIDGVLVLSSPEEEAARAGRARVVDLDLPAELCEALLALDVTTLAGFLALPRGEVGVRFGPVASRLHAGFAGALQVPMQPAHLEPPVVVEAELEPPDDDVHRLLFCIKGGIHALMAELGRRALALGALELTLELERPNRTPHHRERLEPAQPTRDALALLELVRLRLADRRLPARVERVALRAEPARLDGRQLELFAGRRRDPDAAARAIARLRAAFGPHAAARAVLRDAWLPEHRFAYEPAAALEAPAPEPREKGTLVRRLFAAPAPLPSDRSGRPRTTPPLVALSGPYRIQGGWWEQETLRDYFFGERADGALLWLYRAPSGGWFLHGDVD